MTDEFTHHQIALVWEEFWRAGICDPVVILEHLVYLLFLRRLDQDVAGAQHGGAQRRLTSASGPHGHDADSLRWSSLCGLAEREQFAMLNEHIFPRLRGIGGPGGAYVRHLKGARFSVPTAAALACIIRQIDKLPRRTAPGNADPFDYAVDKLANMGRWGATSTPRSIEALMVALVAPVPGDVICTPVGDCGGLLVAAAQYLARRFPSALADPVASEHHHHRMYHAYGADKVILRVACMKLLLQGIKNPDIRYRNTLAPDVNGDEGRYSIILAHPSTTESTAGQGQAIALMVVQCSRMLKPGGRAAIIIPQSILRGHSAAERDLRRMLLLERRIDAAIPLSLSSAAPAKLLLLFTRTDGATASNGGGARAGELAIPPVRARWQMRRTSSVEQPDRPSRHATPGAHRCVPSLGHQ
jgi:type I restriction enzyme M protein